MSCRYEVKAKKQKSDTSLLLPEWKARFVRHGDWPEVMEQAGWCGEQMCGMMRVKKRESGRGRCTVKWNEEWDFREKRWELVFSTQQGSGTNAALRTDRTHEQHHEMVRFLHTTRNSWKIWTWRSSKTNTLQAGPKLWTMWASLSINYYNYVWRTPLYLSQHMKMITYNVGHLFHL